MLVSTKINGLKFEKTVQFREAVFIEDYYDSHIFSEWKEEKNSRSVFYSSFSEVIVVQLYCVILPHFVSLCAVLLVSL